MIDTAAERFSYLATPYTKFEGGIESAWAEACKVSASLLVKGVKVYSPIAHGHSIAMHGNIDPLDHSIWLPFDEAMMIAAHDLIVAHLPGWQDSYGIAHEVKFFEQAGKPIFDLDPVSMVMTRRQS